MNLETGFLIFLAFAVVALCIRPICRTLEDVLVYRDQGYGREATAVRDAMRAAGMSFEDSNDAMYLREEMARLRREASDAVLADPHNWCVALAKAKRDAFDRIALVNKNLLPVFGGMLSGLSYGHILYPDETRVIETMMLVDDLSLDRYRATEDQRAAVKIVRPAS